MRFLLDLSYLVAAVITAPLWLTRMIRTGRIRTDWGGRFGRVLAEARPDSRPCILLHAVSVGEVNAVRLLVERLADHPARLRIIIATTTDTGFARASALFGQRHVVVRYPFDFSWIVRRFLKAIRPDVVGLVELELWPNFTAECRRRGIPVCVINGRLSARSFRRYQRVRTLVRPTFGRVSEAGVQTQEYADRFIALGVPASCVSVTGTMKWDTAQIADHVDGADDLARDMGIDRTRPLIVGGSTAPGEHELLVQATPDGAQLLCAPRRPEWFDQAAHVLAGCARRSTGQCGSETGRFLLDTIGELRKAYALADLVVIGRSFGDLHGSDMAEPVALGKATIVGPAVSDFQDTVDALLAGDGLVQTDADHLSACVHELLNDPDRRAALARRGREIIRSRQGATERHVELLIRAISQRSSTHPHR